MKNYIILKNKKLENAYHILALYNKHIEELVNKSRNSLFVQIINNIRNQNTKTSKELLIKNTTELQYQSNEITLMVEDYLSRDEDLNINWGSYLDLLTYQDSIYFEEKLSVFVIKDDLYISSNAIDINRFYFFLGLINEDAIRIKDKIFTPSNYEHQVFEAYNSVYLYLNFDFINIGDIVFPDSYEYKEDNDTQILEYIQRHIS